MIPLVALLLTTGTPPASEQPLPVVVAPQADSAAIRAALVKSVAGAPLPADAADLDTMLRQREFNRLGARLRDEHDSARVFLDLNWERARIFDGAGIIVVYAYIFDLWRLGVAAPPAVGDGLKQSAAMMLLYAKTLITVDGSRCADPSAPGHRQDQLFGQNREITQYLVRLPRPLRMQAGTIALSIEAATLPLRRDDYVLCSGGLDEISAGLAQGPAAQTAVPTPPGMIGKTVAVATPPGWVPKFVAADVWQAAQAKVRPELGPMLTRLLTVPGDAAPSPVPPQRPN